jgi:CDP-diacylglycerol--glycerol-3-phosphate 3-phosphatidyltransferase
MLNKNVMLQLLTASRLLLGVLFFVWEYYFGLVADYIVVAVLILTFLEVSDALDGYIARKYGLVSNFGKVFDPYTDSISRLLIYFSLSFHGYVWLLVPIVMAIRDVTVSYSRIVLVQNNQNPAARLSGKLKAVFQGVGAFTSILLPLLFPAFIEYYPAGISIMVISVTAWSTYHYVRDAIKSL